MGSAHPQPCGDAKSAAPNAQTTVSEPDYGEEMKLPDGETCDGCKSFARCHIFGFTEPGRKSCDFHPSRFRAVSAKQRGGEGFAVELPE